MPLMTIPSQSPHNTIPADIRCAQDYAVLAQRFMAAPTHAYITGGSGHDRTAAANLAAFGQWAIYPRLLRDVRAGHTRISLAGEAYLHPLFLAPVAFHKLAHGAGETDTARAAHAVGSCMISSTQSSCTLEDIAAVSGPQRWFQLYLQQRREDTLDLVRRAEAAGFRALVLTLDAPIQVANLHALTAQFQMPLDCVAVNLRASSSTGSNSATAIVSGASRVFQAMHGAPGWDDLHWLMGQTRLPLWVKGVLHADDALALRDAGVTGIVVSNHGGRSLDGAPASLDVLPAIRAALGAQFPLLFDGGIRSGSDIFKALALGASAVAVGRLQLYALSVAGALGVAHMIKLLLEELEVCMALAGCTTVDQITPATLHKQTGQPW